MKRLILLLILTGTFIDGQAQTVRGIVFDKSVNVRINFASIYINGTYTGTNTDQNGYFELDISKHNSLPLTISALGYYSVTLTSFEKDKILNIYLTPKTYELGVIVVAARTHQGAREANLKLFRSQFLGSSANGQRCVIMNEEDIFFVNSGDSLKAFASKPIQISNYGLGYRITYYLDAFKFDKKSGFVLYNGSAIFKEDLASGMALSKNYEKRRKRAYVGSISHFFSSLWADSLGASGFSIRDSVGKSIKYEDIVTIENDSKKYLSCKGSLFIYFSLKPPDSCIEMLKEKVFFDRVGYFDGTGVRIIGEMFRQRVGDLLPYDYRVK